MCSRPRATRRTAARSAGESSVRWRISARHRPGAPGRTGRATSHLRSPAFAGLEWILLVIRLQLLVQPRVLLLQPRGLLEEALRRHGEELGGIRGPVLVQ